MARWDTDEIVATRLPVKVHAHLMELTRESGLTRSRVLRTLLERATIDDLQPTTTTRKEALSDGN